MSADVEKAERELEDLADASRRVAKTLTSAQLTVADLEPPISESDDVTVQWKELIGWRDQTTARLRDEERQAGGRVENVRLGQLWGDDPLPSIHDGRRRVSIIFFAEYTDAA